MYFSFVSLLPFAILRINQAESSRPKHEILFFQSHIDYVIWCCLFSISSSFNFRINESFPTFYFRSVHSILHFHHFLYFGYLVSCILCLFSVFFLSDGRNFLWLVYVWGIVKFSERPSKDTYTFFSNKIFSVILSLVSSSFLN